MSESVSPIVVTPSTEEPQTSSAGWIQLKEDPGRWYAAEYNDGCRQYWVDDCVYFHEEVLRVAMIPRPTA